jgi:hypothetical protein
MVEGNQRKRKASSKNVKGETWCFAVAQDCRALAKTNGSKASGPAISAISMGKDRV